MIYTLPAQALQVCFSAMQALRAGVHGGPDGSFRATFEDKPLLSDTVFLRAWVAVDLPRFYNPVTNLLAPPPAPPTVQREHRREEVRRPWSQPKSDRIVACNPDLDYNLKPKPQAEAVILTCVVISCLQALQKPRSSLALTHSACRWRSCQRAGLSFCIVCCWLAACLSMAGVSPTC